MSTGQVPFMNREKYKWFYEPDFLDQDFHKIMLDPDNQCIDTGLSIANDGSISFQKSSVLTNRYPNNIIFKDNIPPVTRSLIEKIESRLMIAGCKVPVLFNFSTLIDPRPTPDMKAYGWHKDFNIITHITDPLKLWFTILTLSKEDVDSEFMVCPTPDGPDFWNIGIKTKATTNKLFGHNMNLGHGYFPHGKNHVRIVYTRWYDAS